MRRGGAFSVCSARPMSDATGSSASMTGQNRGRSPGTGHFKPSEGHYGQAWQDRSGQQFIELLQRVVVAAELCPRGVLPHSGYPAC